MEDGYTNHVFEYEHEGSTWGFTIPARDRADAEERVRKLALYGRWLGDHATEIPAAAGFWVPAWVWLRNRWPKRPSRPTLPPLTGDEEWVECVGQAEEKPKARMIGGWRRFFTRTYWQVQWMCIRSGRGPVNVVSVGTLECPPELEDLLPKPGGREQ